jgi:hypothetical protein
MRVNRFLMPIIVIVALLGTTFIAQAAGFWSTSGRDAIDMESMTAADIKGWMTCSRDGLKISKRSYAAGGFTDVSLTCAIGRRVPISRSARWWRVGSGQFDCHRLDQPTPHRRRHRPRAPVHTQPITGTARRWHQRLPRPATGQPARRSDQRMTLRDVSDQCAAADQHSSLEPAA